MEININNKKYTYITAYKDNNTLRHSLNILTKQTYGFDFEQWYQDGYWSEFHIPHSLVHGDKIVANVSISKMEFHIMGKHRHYMQIGTVMTDPFYRNQGLSRFLIEQILEQWDNKCDLIYLFANDSVLNFYPKFGFRQLEEYQCTKRVVYENCTSQVEKLDMSKITIRNMVLDKIRESGVFNKITMVNNPSLIMFYLTNFLKDNVYYVREIDAIVIAEYCNDTLLIQDFYGKTNSLNKGILPLLNKNITKVQLGFSPLNDKNYMLSPLNAKDTTLFAMGEDFNLMKENPSMFPVLSHS